MLQDKWRIADNVHRCLSCCQQSTSLCPAGHVRWFDRLSLVLLDGMLFGLLIAINWLAGCSLASSLALVKRDEL